MDPQPSPEAPRGTIVSSSYTSQSPDHHTVLDESLGLPEEIPAQSSALPIPTLTTASIQAPIPPPYQSSANPSIVPPPGPRMSQSSPGHMGQQSSNVQAYNMSSMGKALPMPTYSYNQQNIQARHHQPRFQVGPSTAAVAFQISQRLQPYQIGPETQDTQYYQPGSFTQNPAYCTGGYDSYGRWTSAGPPQHQSGYYYPSYHYSSSYPPYYESSGFLHGQYGQSGQHWQAQQAANPYYMAQQMYAGQIAGPIHNHQGPVAPLYLPPPQSQGDAMRRHSVPTAPNSSERTNSDTDLTRTGYLALGGSASSLRDHSSATSRTSSRAVTSPGPPALPRGPPRKPKQSGFALWVGNLPPATNITDLKDYFASGATDSIESVFLISKSNCAFVNYRTEAACSEAMARFHDSLFQNTRVVCRLRRGSSTPSTATQSSTSLTIPTATLSSAPSPTELDGTISKVSAEEEKAESNCIPQAKAPPSGPSGQRSSRGYARDRYFVVKSLTVEDLALSVRDGIWTTQSHNEAHFNEAYESAENVFLIFSANKSGEYYGYARMTSKITDDPDLSIEWAPISENTADRDADLPRAITTSPTESAPRGRIIDDSARGTIFWEAIDLDDERLEDEAGCSDGDGSGEGKAVTKAWGKPFKVEWVSTARVPFYRTRGLKNLLNANRDVKVARDGTELEESVGRRLIQLFHGNRVNQALQASPAAVSSPASGSSISSAP